MQGATIKIQNLETLFDKCSHIVACVDDVFIMGRRLHDFEVLTSLIEQTSKWDYK